MSDIQTRYEIKNKGSRPWKAYLPSIVLYALPYDFRTMLKVRSHTRRGGVLADHTNLNLVVLY